MQQPAQSPSGPEPNQQQYQQIQLEYEERDGTTRANAASACTGSGRAPLQLATSPSLPSASGPLVSPSSGGSAGTAAIGFGTGSGVGGSSLGSRAKSDIGSLIMGAMIASGHRLPTVAAAFGALLKVQQRVFCFLYLQITHTLQYNTVCCPAAQRM